MESPEQSTNNTLFYVKKNAKNKVFYVKNTCAMTILETERNKERYKICERN